VSLSSAYWAPSEFNRWTERRPALAQGTCRAKTDLGSSPTVTCFPIFGPILAGKFQFGGMSDLGRWTRKDYEEIALILRRKAGGRGLLRGRAN
jgi:hypothetical protein